ETRFAGQIIVELEEDRVVSEAAKRLAGKHAERSLIIQLKKDGGYEVVKGNPYLLGGDLHWQVVGHSREGANEGYPGTFRGASAEQLSNQLIALHAQLKKQFRINPRPKYISLVGCSLAAAGVEDKSYARHFGKALKHQAGWQIDIGARRLPVTVNAEGRKLSVVNEAASEEMPDKVVLSWTPEGELVVQKTRFSDRASGVLAPETLSSWEPPLDSLVEPRSAVASLQTGLGDVPPALDRSSDAGEISLSRKALHQMGAMVEGQPLSPEHFTKENGVQKLRFDAQRLAFYLHHADGGELSTQQAVRFLKQQLDVKSPPSLLEGDDKASTMVALEQLNRINEHVQRGAPAPMTSSLDIPPALWGSLKSVLAPAGGARLNRLSARAGFGMQGYGYLRGLRDLKNYRDLLNKGGLTETQKEELIFQHHLAIASFSSNIGIDATQSGLGQYGRRLVQNGISSGVGMNVARFGGPVLGALSSGFDMVQAYRAFSELPSTAEPKARQDLIVNGALSVAGATLNIGMAIAFAVGGQASLLAGPAGLIMGGGLVLGGMIYSAVRQVEELKKWVQLSVLEELDSGWRLFSGEYLAPELANQASRHQMLAHAQAEHQKAQTAQFQTLLLSHGQIEKVYGSLGQILLTPQRYKKIVAHHAGMEEDRVHPDEITQGKRALSDKLNRLKSNLLISGEMTVEDSDYEYYSPTLTSRDDRSDADIMMTLSAGHRQSLGRFVDENTQSLTASLEMKGRHRAPSALGDFNGDGRPDIGYFSPEGLFFLFADENGAYGPVKKMDTKNTFYHGLYANHVRHLVGDINGDGLDDIMFFLNSRDAVQILLGQPTEDFVFKEIKGVKLPALSQAAPVLTDVNGDGHPDWVSFVKNSLYVHYGDAGKMLGMPEEVSHPDAPLHSAQYLHHLAGDINGDGLGDILSVTRDGQLETRLGSRTPGQPLRRLANQTQAAVQGFGGVFNPSQLQLHDMNGDGRSDLVVIQDDGSYTMSYGQAEGTLGEASDDKSREEQGAKVAYRPNRLAKQNEQKIVGIRQGAVHLELISLNEQGEVHAHPFESRREKDLIAYYKLGDGEDEMTGQPSRRNYFDVGGGGQKVHGRVLRRYFFTARAAGTESTRPFQRCGPYPC
ncbi:C80 family cysteine peptidase, partial [Candidatus Williamhamiltonella defendens]|uniref:C80 family cysteine peptidase n=1 Tax=Candidatus Williamhamiltonella defendens TaxID=138072 RepID=UPI0015813CCF